MENVVDHEVEQKMSILKEDFYNPPIEKVYVPPLNPSYKRFLSKVWTAFVNKMVFLTFEDDEYLFEYSMFEAIDGDALKVKATAAGYALKDYEDSEENHQDEIFNGPFARIPIKDERNLTARFIQKAILDVQQGLKPEVQIFSVAGAQGLHPDIQRILKPDMNFLAGIPLFVRGEPIGMLWGIRKHRFSQLQKKYLAWQLVALYDGIVNILEQEIDRGKDAYYTRRLIEKLDTTSQVFKIYYTEREKQKLPIKSIIAHAYRFDKTFRQDTSFIIPTSNGFSISLKLYLPEEINNSNKVLLMIPGFFCNRSLMDRLARQMSLGYDYPVLALDVRGRSKYTLPEKGGIGSGWTVDDYIWEDFPTALKWIQKNMPGKKVVIYGHSMGGMIPRFYAAAYRKMRIAEKQALLQKTILQRQNGEEKGILSLAKKVFKFGSYTENEREEMVKQLQELLTGSTRIPVSTDNLPDPEEIIAGIVSITSPSYVDLDARIPGFETLKNVGRAIGNSFISDLLFQILSLGLFSPVATVDLHKFFTMLGNLSNSLRMLHWNIGQNLPTIKDFIGYEQITPPEWYFFMENVFCEESIKVIIQFVRSQFNNNSFSSYDGSLNYTEELQNLTLPVFSVIGTKDTLAPPQTAQYGFDMMRSKNKKLVEYPQGHMGVVVHPETVRKLAADSHEWIQTLD
ncbi:MAG: alpha/beta fold hydrolase [Candidatus Hydrogenedentota bacterium]|nr:MAG: alpha/beta fold hydrolase [Candidatus Hydrogenedentota bacterium]